MARVRAKKTVVHVNQHEIRANNKDGGNRPVITIKHGKRNIYAHEAVIEGPSKVIYSPEKPLKCGARVWIEVPDCVDVIRHWRRKLLPDGALLAKSARLVVLRKTA